MGNENQDRQLQEMGQEEVTNIKMVVDAVQRESPLGTDRKPLAFSQYEKQRTER